MAIDMVDDVLATDARYAHHVDTFDGLWQSESSRQWEFLEIEVKDPFAEAL